MLALERRLCPLVMSDAIGTGRGYNSGIQLLCTEKGSVKGRVRVCVFPLPLYFQFPYTNTCKYCFFFFFNNELDVRIPSWKVGYGVHRSPLPPQGGKGDAFNLASVGELSIGELSIDAHL